MTCVWYLFYFATSSFSLCLAFHLHTCFFSPTFPIFYYRPSSLSYTCTFSLLPPSLCSLLPSLLQHISASSLYSMFSSILPQSYFFLFNSLHLRSPSFPLSSSFVAFSSRKYTSTTSLLPPLVLCSLPFQLSHQLQPLPRTSSEVWLASLPICLASSLCWLERNCFASPWLAGFCKGVCTM